MQDRIEKTVELRAPVSHVPGYEHFRWEATVTAKDDPAAEYATQPHTLVEFRLEPSVDGTRLHICESGFSALPDDARPLEAFRMNSKGWDEQARNIAAHVES